MESTEADDESGWNCSVHPSVFFLLGTLVLTTCATAMLCGAIMTDHWEEVTWDQNELEAVANNTVRLKWLLDGAVVRISTNDEKDTLKAFLVPMHGGIWTLCVSLTGMQNLSISCALVCLIILGSAALVGAFGVCQHQISAVLVTGVMYLLAASFALFTLTIIHFKRVQSKPRLAMDADGTVDGVVIPFGGKVLESLLTARVFTTSWSLDLGWGGVVLTVMTSILWILLSKIMRFNPISSMIN